jgi:hypothetical protein
MTALHFTAWMTNDPSTLSGDNMDVMILKDTLDSVPEKAPEWVSTGEDVFHTETNVNASEGDVADGIREAEELMKAAGWEVVGEWEAVTTSYLATVEYTGAYRHTIESTANAADPTWDVVRRGDVAEEYNGTPEEYGRSVGAFWLEYNASGDDDPLSFEDEDGNPYYRVLVRTQDDTGTLVTVEIK